MFKNIFIAIFLFFGFSASAQYKFYHDAGIMAGPVFFQSDYGERGNFKNITGNSGYSIGAFYYFNLDDNFKGFDRYFKFRVEASYFKNDLQHFGKWVDQSRTSVYANQLRGMRGSTSAINGGFQVEFYPWETEDYNGKTDFSPYLSLGSQYSYYTSKAYSQLGVLGTPAVTYPKYMNGAFRNDSKGVVSITASLGTRYRLDDQSSLVADLRFQYFTSDWVDGLNPNRRIYKENKTNDWLVWFNIGYIYSFED